MIRPLLRPPNRGRDSAAFLLAAAVAAQSTQCAIISPVITSDLTEVRQKAEARDSQAQDALAEAYYHTRLLFISTMGYSATGPTLDDVSVQWIGR